MTKEPAYAVLRFDDHHARVSVVKVVLSIEAAEAEVARLNALNAWKGCHYNWQTTRLITDEA